MNAVRRLITLAGCLFLLGASAPSLRLRAQTPPVDSGTTIKTESRLVIVDTVVTDKKGAYIEDLTQKNFRVFEDGKEMDLKSFSSEAEGAASGKAQQRYIVLFFDNSTMDFGDQARARQAGAAKCHDHTRRPGCRPTLLRWHADHAVLYPAPTTHDDQRKRNDPQMRIGCEDHHR